MICTARIASLGLNGRIDTTIGPANGPDGVHAMLLRYIGTRTLRSMWRIGRSSAISASSNENEHPSTNATMSSRQCANMSVGSSSTEPLRQTR